MASLGAGGVFESLGLPVWSVDAASGAILHCNARAAECCGWTGDAARHTLAELSQLLTVDMARGPQPLGREHLDLLADRTLAGWLRRPGQEPLPVTLVTGALPSARRARHRLLIAVAAPAPPAAPVEALAAGVAHELNNVTASLNGFIELAGGPQAGPERLRECLGELGIGVARIRTLAAELEAVGDSRVERTRMALAECMTGSGDGGADPPPIVEWRCSATTLVEADPVHARRALQALARIAGAGPAPPRIVGRERAAEAGRETCAACGEAIAPRGVLLAAELRGTAGAVQEALSHPFAARRLGRAARGLTLAALVQAAHRAGGHVVLDTGTGSLGIVLSCA